MNSFFLFSSFFLLLFNSFLCASVYSNYDYHNKVGIPSASTIFERDSDLASRIVGGVETSLGQYGFQAGILITLTTGWSSVCGGSLISRNRVLTAAHCWWDGVTQAQSFTVVLGSTTLSSGGTRLVASGVMVHPNWNVEEVTHDVALAVIPDVTFSNNIYAVPLPEISDANESFAGYSAVASGFGRTGVFAVSPNTATLHHVEVPIITNAQCQVDFELVIHGSHLCTGGVGGRGTCDGDSGGPLTVLWKNRRTLVGISSFGPEEGCLRGLPSVYTRVTAFLNWINANL